MTSAPSVDPVTRSFIEEDEARGELRFSMHTDRLHLTGVMERNAGPQLVQCTRLSPGSRQPAVVWRGPAQVRRLDHRQ
jgi:hypothetical protein